MANPNLMGIYISRCFDAGELDNPRFLAEEIIYLVSENKLTEEQADTLLSILRAAARCVKGKE